MKMHDAFLDWEHGSSTTTELQKTLRLFSQPFKPVGEMGTSGDVVQAGVGAAAGKRLLRHLQNALAVPQRVGTTRRPGALEAKTGAPPVGELHLDIVSESVRF